MFLKPDKFTKLDKSLLYATGLVIKIFKKNNYKCKYSNLYLDLEELMGSDSYYFFLPALDLLFLLGKLEYNMQSDTLEMIR